MKTRSVSFVTLGCSKNEVDSEIMLALLAKRGWQPSPAIRGSDLVVVNTCAFIRPATDESIEAIRELVRLRRRGEIGHLIVAGCLPQKHRLEDLLESAHEVDAFIGTGDIHRIAPAADAALLGDRTADLRDPESRKLGFLPRLAAGAKHSRYIKVSEGCSNACAYCLIPTLRGQHRSRPFRAILREIEQLAEENPISELNLIGQDTTAYGTDLYGRPRLPELLRRISALGLAKWIRVLYAHPAHISDELIETMAELPGLCRYLDLPMQHASDGILERMGRHTSRTDLESLVQKLRSGIPGIAIRTAFIVGFPGETEHDFDQLLEFVKATRFERLGAFMYSREEGTRAARMGRQVPEKLKKERLRRLLTVQRKIARELNEQLVGKELEALVDETTGGAHSSTALARTERHAPEVDGEVIVHRAAAQPGQFLKVRITRALDYDLLAVKTGTHPISPNKPGGHHRTHNPSASGG